MPISATRWTAYAAALVLGSIGVWLVEGSPTTTRTVVEPEPRAGAATGESLKASAFRELDMRRLTDRTPGEMTGDPFEPNPWGRAQTEEVRRNAPPPPPPQAPSLPFALMGKLIDDGETIIFLTKGDRSYVVRLGDTIDGTYRVEEIGERTMTFTYLPLDSKHVLAVGSGTLGFAAGIQPTFSTATGIALPPDASASASAEPGRLVLRAPGEVAIGEDFTIEVGLPSGPHPRSGRLELVYDGRVLAVLGGAAAAPARPGDRTSARRALVDVIGPGFPGAPPTPSEVRFRVLAADPTSTRIGIENVSAVAAGKPLAIANPVVHELAMVRVQASRNKSN